MMARGTITRLVWDRGFGTIAANGQEFFFNQSALQGVQFEELAEGQEVVFNPDFDAPGDTPDERPRAVSIQLSDDEIPAVDGEVLAPEKLGG
jgi:cold shock CspA family protein